MAEGVFNHFPSLRVVLIESGVTWLPGFLWRAIKSWRGLRGETPWFTRSPADLLRQHVRLTVQPFDAPGNGRVVNASSSISTATRCCCSPPTSRIGISRARCAAAGFPPMSIRKLAVDNPLATYPRPEGDAVMSEVLDAIPRASTIGSGSSTAISIRRRARRRSCTPGCQSAGASIWRSMVHRRGCRSAPARNIRKPRRRPLGATRGRQQAARPVRIWLSCSTQLLDAERHRVRHPVAVAWQRAQHRCRCGSLYRSERVADRVLGEARAATARQRHCSAGRS